MSIILKIKRKTQYRMKSDMIKCLHDDNTTTATTTTTNDDDNDHDHDSNCNIIVDSYYKSNNNKLDINFSSIMTIIIVHRGVPQIKKGYTPH